MRARGVLAAGLLLAWLAPAHAELIDGYNSSRNDRFIAATFPGNTPPTPNPNFFLSAADLSGIGWLPTTNGNGTFHIAMISPVDFVGAWHTHPNLNGNPNVNFRAKDGSSVSRSIVGLTQVAGSDVLVGRLNSPVPGGATGVAHYPVAFGLESDFIGLSFYMVGQNSRVGRNVVGGFLTTNVNLNGAGNTREAFSDYDPFGDADGLGYANPSPPTDEFLVTFGDSGSPSFFFINNQVSLLGPHSVQYEYSPGNPAGSGDAFLANYATGINSALSPGYTLGLVGVPEPTSFCLMAMPIAGWLWRRRRAA